MGNLSLRAVCECKGKLFIKNEFGPESFSKVKRQIWDVVLLSLESCQTKVIHRKNSFEVLGYDFMVDQDLRVWLIEINSSPAMDYSTVLVGLNIAHYRENSQERCE